MAIGTYFYAPAGESNVKNMLKDDVALWKKELKSTIATS